jgi:hypothetical protein
MSEVYPAESCMSTPRGDPPEPCCPLCGRRARHRGRRDRLAIYECIDDECVITIFEVLDDPASAERPGGRP